MTFGFNIKLFNERKIQSDGWVHQEGWPVVFEVNFSYDTQIYDLVIYDIDGDNNLDVIFTYSLSDSESYIDAFEYDGSQKKNLGFPILLPGKILSEVSIGDLDNNGYVEIVASISVFTSDFHTTIYVFEYDGEKFVETWHFMESKKSGEIIYSPSLGDIDGDGDLEIISGNQRYDNQWKNIVYALHHDGKMVSGWPITNKFYFGSFYATPAIGDIDNDGFSEVVVGSYFNYLYAWDGNGDRVSGNWPVYLNDDVRSHSPQLGDLDCDGDIEIVQIGARYGNISILDGQGNIIQTLYPDVADFCNTPSLGDIDGDGDLEIFVNVGDLIYGWHHNGLMIDGNWPIYIANITRNARTSIIIGDVNNDILPDIIYMYENSMDGIEIFSYYSNGTLIAGWPYSFEKASNLHSSPTIVDIDRDGDVEIAFTYLYYENYPYQFCNLTIDILDLSELYNAVTMHWSMFQHNTCHTGLYQKPLNNPPEKPYINGPTKGGIGTEYTFFAKANDSDDDNISYLFNWGDGKNSGWTDFVDSGTIVNSSHIWQKSGSYTIKVKAKDSNAAQSEWAIFQVTMPRSKAVSNSLFLRILEQYPLIQKVLLYLIK
ncbi:hypothetical protein AYK24_04815 [Thermoplasmatales archaeon SG8-52-4]|nr:MAG: hypothetical protein AYK24_04815 [Thermoplasmatales archaeon SG8-52-4]